MLRTLIISLLLIAEVSASAGQEKLGQMRHRTPIVPVKAFDLKQLVAGDKGKVVVMNFWATWCAPCVEEFPDLLRLRSAYADRGLEIIFVSIDNPKKSLPQVNTFLKGKGVDFPTYIKEAGGDEAFINSIDSTWSGAIPATFIYDKRGSVVHKRIDAQTFEQLAGLVVPLLKR